MSEHYIGSTWKAVDSLGVTAYIWLDKIEQKVEMWRWMIRYPNGSQMKSEWRTTYYGCYKECRYKLENDPNATYLPEDYKETPRFHRARDREYEE